MRKLKDESTFVEGYADCCVTYNNGHRILIITDKKGDKIAIPEDIFYHVYDNIVLKNSEYESNSENPLLRQKNNDVYDYGFNEIFNDMFNDFFKRKPQ